MPRPKELVILLGLAVMEGSAALPIFIGIGFLSTRGPLLRPELFLLWAVLAGGAAALLTVVYGRASWVGRFALAIGALASVIAPTVLTTSAIGAAAALLLALGFVYWRGIAVVMAEPDGEDIVFRFSMGLGLIIIGCVVVTARGMMFEPRVATLLTLSGVVFVLATLVGLAAASMQRSIAGGGVATSIAALGVFLVLMSGLALLSFAVVTSHIGGAIATILSPIWDAIVLAIALLLTFLLSPLFTLIQRTHFRLPRMPVISTPNTFGHKIPTPTPRQIHPVLISRSTDALLAALVIGAAILLLGFIIWRTASALGGRKRSVENDDREVMEWSPRDIMRGVAAWFRGLFRGTVQTAVQTVQHVRSRIAGPSYPSDPVRRVYAQILYRASVNGLARPPAATPLEFQRALTHEWPDGAGDFAAVTEAYMRRRYGEMPSSPEEIAGLRRRWQHLRTVMRRPKPAT